MRNNTKNAVLRLFPELEGKLHLPRYARVLQHPDAPEQGGTCERFRPRYAVDLQIMTPDLEVDPRFPIYEAVPVPVPAGGHEQGFFALPAEGTLVTVQFVFGRPDHPVIQQIYPMGCELPPVHELEHVWAQNGTVLQQADKNGNWSRQTDQSITDDGLAIIHNAIDSIDSFVRKIQTITEHSTEEIGGIKRIEALGALKLLTAGHANLSAGGNLNLTTASDLNEIVSRNRQSITQIDETTTVKRNASHTIDKNHTRKVGASQTLSVAKQQSESIGADCTRSIGGSYSDSVSGTYTRKVSGTVSTQAGGAASHKAGGCYSITAPTISIGSGAGGVSLLQEMTQCWGEVRQALAVIAGHTHTTTKEGSPTSAPNRSGTIAGHGNAVDGHQGPDAGIMG